MIRRILILLFPVLLLAACDHGNVGDPSKPQSHLLTAGAASTATEPGSGTADAATASETGTATEEPAQPPEDFVREFFKTYMDSIDERSWFGNRDLLSPWFSAELTRQFLANDKACQDVDADACNLDFDPIIDAQDYDDVYSTLHTGRIGTGAPVRVKVDFINLGERKTMTYTLIQVDDGWRIADIQSSSYGKLSSLLSADGAPAI